MPPREIDIERLVQWAYREELPKRGGGTLANRWDVVSEYGERGWTGIDIEPGFPPAMGVPHVDAIKLDEAVKGLNDEVKLSWSEHRVLLLGDIIGIAPDDDPLTHRVFSESALVTNFGRLGATPLWRGERPLPTPIVKKGVVMLVGRCQGRDRYDAGSHCLVRYLPEVSQVALRRAEYLVWRDGLVRLAGLLRAWTLRDFVALPPKAPALPWLDAAVARPEPISGVKPAWTYQPTPPRARGDKAAIKTAVTTER